MVRGNGSGKKRGIEEDERSSARGPSKRAKKGGGELAKQQQAVRPHTVSSSTSALHAAPSIVTSNNVREPQETAPCESTVPTPDLRQQESSDKPLTPRSSQYVEKSNKQVKPDHIVFQKEKDTKAAKTTECLEISPKTTDRSLSTVAKRRKRHMVAVIFVPFLFIGIFQWYSWKKSAFVDEESPSLTNSTLKRAQIVGRHDSTSVAVGHGLLASFERFFFDLKKYERQSHALTKVEDELVRTLAELQDSRIDASMAKREVQDARNDHAVIVSKLELEKNKLEDQYANALAELETSQTSMTLLREELKDAWKNRTDVMMEVEQRTNELAKQERQLRDALDELNHARRDVVSTRQEVTSTRNEYDVLVAELQKAKHELLEEQRRFGIVVHELNHTREELERTRLDQALIASDLETVLYQLNSAHENIEKLYQLLHMQEMVAAHTLNFVTTTALREQQEVAMQALNFVTKMAVNQQQEAATHALNFVATIATDHKRNGDKTIMLSAPTATTMTPVTCKQNREDSLT